MGARQRDGQAQKRHEQKKCSGLSRSTPPPCCWAASPLGRGRGKGKGQEMGPNLSELAGGDVRRLKPGKLDATALQWGRNDDGIKCAKRLPSGRCSDIRAGWPHGRLFALQPSARLLRHALVWLRARRRRGGMHSKAAVAQAADQTHGRGAAQAGVGGFQQRWGEQPIAALDAEDRGRGGRQHGHHAWRGMKHGGSRVGSGCWLLPEPGRLSAGSRGGLAAAAGGLHAAARGLPANFCCLPARLPARAIAASEHEQFLLTPSPPPPPGRRVATSGLAALSLGLPARAFSSRLPWL